MERFRISLYIEIISQTNTIVKLKNHEYKSGKRIIPRYTVWNFRTISLSVEDISPFSKYQSSEPVKSNTI